VFCRHSGELFIFNVLLILLLEQTELTSFLPANHLLIFGTALVAVNWFLLHSAGQRVCDPATWPSVWQERLVCMQSLIAFAFCWILRRRNVLECLIFEANSDGHGVAPVGLFIEPGKPKYVHS
jgi:hypothetical protein